MIPAIPPQNSPSFASGRGVGFSFVGVSLQAVSRSKNAMAMDDLFIVSMTSQVG
jgi:hypothetical protein